MADGVWAKPGDNVAIWKPGAGGEHTGYGTVRAVRNGSVSLTMPDGSAKVVGLGDISPAPYHRADGGKVVGKRTKRRLDRKVK